MRTLFVLISEHLNLRKLKKNRTIEDLQNEIVAKFNTLIANLHN